MLKIREFIRQYARQDNWFGFSCSVLVYLFRKGPRATAKLIAERNWRNRERKNAYKLLLISEEELQQQRKASNDISVLFSIVTPLYNTPVAFLRELIESVTSQTYPHWELCFVDGSDENHPEVGTICKEYISRDPRIKYSKLLHNEGISANTNACIAIASGDYIALLDHDDLLQPNALYENAKAIETTGADFLYSDEYVFISPDIRKIMNTHFKPDFSPEALLTNNYICHLTVFKRSLLDLAGGFRPEFDGSQDHDLILRLTDCAKKVVHIPKPLYLWRSHSASVASDISVKTYAIEAGRGAVKAFLDSKGIAAKVESVDASPTMYHVRYPVSIDSSICIILDLFDASTTPDEAEQYIENLKKHSGWSLLSFALITGNRNTDGKDTDDIKWFVTCETCRPKRFNEVIRKTTSDYIVVLDSSLKCISDNWLQEMLMLAQQDPIGSVGGRLLFRNHRVRHAGLTLGLGKHHLVGRRFYRFPETQPGYFGQLIVVQDVSAVSGECMMISREKFERVGGFSEEYQTCLFDVDFCLKLKELHYRNVYCPFSKFMGGKNHRFPIDYGSEFKEYKTDAETLRNKWGDFLSFPDPYYNPNLSLDHIDYMIQSSS